VRRQTRPFAIIVSAGLLALSLSACGETKTPGANPPAATTSGAETETFTAFNPCTGLTTAEVGAVLGGAVTTREVPGGGCLFSQDDPRAPSISVTNGVAKDLGGGIDSARIGSESQIDGKAESLAGVGTAAFIVVGKGKVIPTESIQAAGGVEVKGQLITVAFTQGQKLPADQVTKLITDVVKLIAAKA
jgi:hypothetical protein